MAEHNQSIYNITKKVIMSLTGLFLITFLVEHLMGNLLLLKGDGGEAFNEYAHFMATNPLIRVMEIVLFAGFLFHIVDGLVLTFQRKKSRPVPYAVQKSSPDSSWVSRNMGLTGSIILIFLVVHLQSFFVPERILGADESLFVQVKSAFENVWYSGFYLVAMALLGLHLAHGFSSAFQTLGLRHKSYFSILRTIGVIYAIVVPAGYAVIPIYFYINQFL